MFYLFIKSETFKKWHGNSNIHSHPFIKPPTSICILHWGFDSCLELLEKVTVNADSSILRANICAVPHTFPCGELKKSTRKFKISTHPLSTTCTSWQRKKTRKCWEVLNYQVIEYSWRKKNSLLILYWIH